MRQQVSAFNGTARGGIVRQAATKTLFWVISLCLLPTIFGGCVSTTLRRVQPADLKSMLGKEGVVVIDARTNREWNKSDMKIEGAVHNDPLDVPSWSGKYRDKKLIILYCS